MRGLPFMMKRATRAQKDLLLWLLGKHGLIPRQLCASDRTGPTWRALFRAAGTPEPKDAFSWPTVDEWMGDLAITEASAAIEHLQEGRASR